MFRRDRQGQPQPRQTEQPATQTPALQRAAQAGVKIVNGLVGLFANMGRSAKQAEFTDEAMVQTTGGSMAWGRTTVTVTGDPAEVAQVQAEVEKARIGAQQAVQQARAAAETAEGEGH